MYKFRKCTFFIVMACSFSLFSTSASAAWKRLSKDTIELRGDIEKNSYNDYIEVASNGYSKILVHSGGGYPSIALKIAEDIVKHRPVEVEVDGLCLSACASYIAMAGSSLEVNCNSILGWHGTLLTGEKASLSLRAEGAPDGLIKDYSHWLEDFHKKESNFYKNIGVNYKIFNRIENDINRITDEEKYHFDSDVGEYSYTNTPAIWIAQKNILSEYGINAKKYCGIYTESNINEIMKKYEVKSKFFLAN